MVAISCRTAYTSFMLSNPVTPSPLLDPESILKDVFGYDSFRGQQRDVINYVMEGGSCCALMPTGAGKSLCYQIPALCRPGVGVIVSPLIALMQDQVSALTELGVRAAAIHSGLDYSEVQATFRAMQSGNIDLVYIAPERLMTEPILDMLDNIEIALFAIDEAHCVSQWGHDFRREYRELKILRTRYPSVPCIAVTATADEPTRQDILAQMNLSKIFIAPFDRPNIRYDVVVKDNTRRQLLDFLSHHKGSSGIIYCLSRKKTEDIAAILQSNGYAALPYHAGLDSNTRSLHQDRFLKEEGVIIVATIAFGMGINKPDVRFVAHIDLPQNIEAYYQETGRAGRDGLPAVAWMAYGLQDVALRRQMIAGSNAHESQKRIEHEKLSSLIGYCEAAHCRRQILLDYFGDASTPCGNCNTCKNPPATIDGMLAAQKLISCVYRTGQMFGTKHVIDVLLGVQTEQTTKHGHTNLSTWGIGSDHERKTWESFMRQLVSANLLYVDMNEYSSVKITENGAKFLKEKTSLQLRLPPPRAGRSRTQNESASETIIASPADRALFDQLRALRLTLAQESNLPPYVIFHDKTLLEMAVRRPLSLNSLAEMPGVGRSKLEKYGQLFLNVIKAQS
jgi:ATP-dependent DNA helicase RecQ